MNPSNLTILSARDGISIKSRMKYLFQTNFKIPKEEKEEFANNFRFGGHQPLRTNLIKGLHAAGIEFELSDQLSLNQSNVGLLAGVKLLRELNQERNLNIENIVVGPNLFLTPKGFDSELQNKLVKAIVVPAQWVADYWSREMPEISHKIVIWTVGVDFNYWQPLALKQETSNSKVIIYVKSQDDLLVNEVKLLLKKSGFLFSIITYGCYSEEHYRKELQSSVALIYIGKSESQGIALLEAWAMNVPTFVYNAKEAMVIQSEAGAIYLQENNYSTAPYLTEERGLFWNTTSELQSHLSAIAKFAPRSNSEMFSAEKCAIEYARLFGYS